MAFELEEDYLLDIEIYIHISHDINIINNKLIQRHGILTHLRKSDAIVLLLFFWFSLCLLEKVFFLGFVKLLEQKDNNGLQSSPL